MKMIKLACLLLIKTKTLLQLSTILTNIYCGYAYSIFILQCLSNWQFIIFQAQMFFYDWKRLNKMMNSKFEIILWLNGILKELISRESHIKIVIHNYKVCFQHQLLNWLFTIKNSSSDILWILHRNQGRVNTKDVDYWQRCLQIRRGRCRETPEDFLKRNKSLLMTRWSQRSLETDWCYIDTVTMVVTGKKYKWRYVNLHNMT